MTEPLRDTGRDHAGAALDCPPAAVVFRTGSEPAAARQDAVAHDPFAGGPLLRVMPTTQPQREVWLADRLGDDASRAYNESILLRLRGVLDFAALERGLSALRARHDALHATFGGDGETLCIGAPAPLPLEIIDLRGEPPARRDALAAARRLAAVERCFDLQHGPLLRAELHRLGDDDATLMLTAHHAVCDGWSWWLLVRELGALYAVEAGHDVPPLPPALSFADHALAQAARGADAVALADEAYWRGRFADEVPVLELPTDRPRPSRRGFASAREDHALDAALVSDLRRLGARRGASLFATLLGAFAALLSRLAGQSTVVVGIPAAGQAVDGLDTLVGHCVNLLPLRFDIDPVQPFDASVDDAQATLLDALEHQRLTFGTLLQTLQVPRDPSRLPLVSVMFNIDQAIDGGPDHFPGLTLEFATNARSRENFELFVNAVQLQGGLVLECQYNTGLFDAATVRGWMCGFETLLRAAAAHAALPVGDLPLVDAAGLVALHALQPPATPVPAGLPVQALFEAQCARAPLRMALRHRGAAWSYAELEARAGDIARRLRTLGVPPGALVGLALPRGPDMVAALLGILKAGAGYVPLDPAFPAERLAYMVGDAGLAALVTVAADAARFDLRGRPVLVLDAPGALDAAGAGAAGDDPALSGNGAVAVGGEAVAYVIYTSGSTGRPKGVQVPHRAVVNFLLAMQARPGIGADDRLLAVTTLSFDIAVLELLLPLSVGAEVVLADRDDAMDGEALARLVADSGATLMQATPSTWRLLLDAGWRAPPGFRRLCGGEPLPPDLAAALCAGGGETWNMYGPTETTVWSTCCRIDDPAAPIGIGTPVANTTVWILDPRGQPCLPGVPGELYIGGEGVALGYLGRPELTAERFVRDAWTAGATRPLYRTGDRARWRPDGSLEHLGRLDFQVKLRGYRIELGDVEAALATLPGVSQVLAMVRSDRPGDARLVAYVVAPDAPAFAEPALAAHARASLPDYMVPQRLLRLDALPLLPNGKLDRGALPAPDAAVEDGARVAPRDDLERAVADAMSQVLGVPALGIHDSFFALGGHSLLAAQLTSRLNRELGASLSLRALFDGPTVAQLAAAVRSASAAGPRAPIPRRAPGSDAPLSLMQERLWLLEQFHPGQLTYNTPSAHRLRGPFDVDAFARAFDALLARQAVLRTAIVEVDGLPVQRVLDHVDSGLRDVEDLVALPDAAREPALDDRIRQLIHVPFDLGCAPLFTARLFRLADDHHVLFFMAHHAIWDGWSFDVLYGDIAALYEAELAGREAALPPLAMDYGDFAAWHRTWVQGPEYAAQLAFWRQQLGDASRHMRPLPTDFPRRAGMSGVGQPQPVAVSRPRTDALHALALSLDATLFTMLLAVYFALVSAATGQRDILVATPVRGRDREETEGLMGYFTNLLPLRVQVDPGEPFPVLLARVKSVLLDSLAHPDIRLEDLMRELAVRDGDGGTVLYHALFSFQDIRNRVLRWGDAVHDRVRISKPGATEDLGVWFVENEHGLSGALTFNVDLLLPETAARLWQRFDAMLQSLVDAPAQAVASLVAFDDGAPAVIGRAQDGPAVPVAPDAQQAPDVRDAHDTQDAGDVRGAGEARDAAPTATAAPAALAVDEDLAPRVQEIWADVLACDAVAADDDFFDLGGHSLQAVQLFHRVNRETGVNLPLATLFTARTPRALARAYRDAADRAGAPSTPVAPSTVGDVGARGAARDPWVPLVPIRAGGDRAPLFFIHAVGGNVLNYRALAEALPRDRPVYGLQAVGLDGRTPPLERIEDMASRYVAELRLVQPAGPYHLAGGSMGGMVAYEMARQLAASGDAVGLLALIDTSALYGLQQRQSAHRGAWWKLRERLRGKDLLASGRALGEIAGARWRRWRTRRRLADAHARDAQAELPHDLRYARIEAAHFRAYRQYEVRPYPGTLTLFRACRQRPGFEGLPALGWEPLVDAVRVVEVPGDHDVIVEAPELAQGLAAALADAGR